MLDVRCSMFIFFIPRPPRLSFPQSKIPPGPLPARRLIGHGLTGRRVGHNGPCGFRLGDRAYSSERPEAASFFPIQGHVILSHITLKFHYFSKIIKFSRNDATKFIDSVASLRRCVSQFLSRHDWCNDFDETLFPHPSVLLFPTFSSSHLPNFSHFTHSAFQIPSIPSFSSTFIVLFSAIFSKYPPFSVLFGGCFRGREYIWST